MKSDDWYMHFIWVIWLSILTVYTVNYVPSIVGKSTKRYQLVGMTVVEGNPYLRAPVYVDKRNMRSWVYMREADKVAYAKKKGYLK
jgi:hypothetical protein